jgi:uncharacterized protein (AIM24 family)
MRARNRLICEAEWVTSVLALARRAAIDFTQTLARAATLLLRTPSHRGARAMPLAHEIDYKIHGHEMQYVEVELDPGESAVAEAGSLMYKDVAVEMTTVFGDGSRQQQNAGLVDLLVGAGKRLLTGESLFTTVFTHRGSGKARVAFAAPYPGTILALDLDQFGGKLICQKDAFLAAPKVCPSASRFRNAS